MLPAVPMTSPCSARWRLALATASRSSAKSNSLMSGPLRNVDHACLPSPHEVCSVMWVDHPKVPSGGVPIVPTDVKDGRHVHRFDWRPAAPEWRQRSLACSRG